MIDEDDKQSNSLPTEPPNEPHNGRPEASQEQISLPTQTPIFRLNSLPSLSDDDENQGNTGIQISKTPTPEDYQHSAETKMSFRGLHNVTPYRPTSLASREILTPVPKLRKHLSTNSFYEPSTTPATFALGSSQLLAAPQQHLVAAQPMTRARSQSELPLVDPDAKFPSIAYDVLDEEAPSHPFFSAVFQAKLQKGIEVAKRTVNMMSLFPLVRDRVLDALLEDAKGLCAFHGSDTRTIAVLGDSGQGRLCNDWKHGDVVLTIVGKSSLINSLLHFPGLARTVSIIHMDHRKAELIFCFRETPAQLAHR